ncbi:MAG: methyltransferase domain-containing protein [Methylococcales bacterium]|nr:methyltransferase domain-containing protein [Methylococcales bacterium]
MSLVSYYNSLTSGSKIVLKIKEIANSLYTDARGTYEQISPSQRKKLLASFEQSNWRLANEFLGREDGVLFYDLSIKQTDQEWNEKYNYKGSDFYSLLCDVIDFLSFDNKRADKLNNIENDSDLNSLPDVGTEKKDSNNKLKIHSQCTICEKQLLFECIDDFDSCRDSLVSSDCPLNQCVTRERSLAKVFFDLIPRETLFSKYIHEAAPSNRGLSMLLSSHCENYIKSGYFPKMPFGQILNDKVINQNLEKQTFENDFFDVVIHLDVMEHLFNPFAALKEIYRTLKPAGICLFTVPTYPSIVESKQVAFINETGELSIIGEPEYHGNPQRPEDGALVTWRYGYDLQALISRYTDFDVEIRRYQDKSSAVMGHMTEVYILRKSMNYGKLTNSKSRGEAV